MKTNSANLFLALSLVFVLYLSAFAQEPTPTPTPTPAPKPSVPDEPVKIVTEEVKLNVMARSKYGKDVPTLMPDDLLIVEEGTPQTITSMRRVPANVLFLLDTGGNLNFAKSTALTSLAATILIDSLAPDDNIAVIQYNDKVETIADWTQDREAVIESIDKRLFASKRSRFSDGLNAAVDIFNSRPLENRHLVLISDGLESVADEAARQSALQNILAANITIHVISYTQLEAKRTKEASRRITRGKGDTKPRIPKWVFDDMMRSLPISNPERKNKVADFLRAGNEAQRLIIINLDNKKIAVLRKKIVALQESETKMKTLAEDTGGVFHAPEEMITVFEFGLEIASVIGSQYVITYSPTKPVTANVPFETRKVRVGTHRQGVEIRSRQMLILKPANQMPK